MTSPVAIELELLANVQGGGNCTVWDLKNQPNAAAAAAAHMQCINDQRKNAGLDTWGTPPGQPLNS